MLFGRKKIINPFQRSAIRNYRPQQRIRLATPTFQWKYSLFLISAVVGSLLLFYAPTFYFVQQNYKIFVRLSYLQSPQLVEYLEREVQWLFTFLVISTIFSILFTFYIVRRMSLHLMTPLQRLEKHIRQVSRGDLAQPPLKSRGKEDFGELYESYNYLYRSLQAHTEAEIKKMETLTLDPQHREAYFNWKRLIETKQNQLGIKKAS